MVWRNLSREAEAKVKIAGANNVRAACTGPATAMVATLARIGWSIDGAHLVTTDLGTQLNFRLDSPQAVKKEVQEAVRRWRWRRVEKALPQLSDGGSGRGLGMDGIWKLLKPSHRSPTWSSEHRGALKSPWVCRQWTQSRLHRAGLVHHDKC